MPGVPPTIIPVSVHMVKYRATCMSWPPLDVDMMREHSTLFKTDACTFHTTRTRVPLVSRHGRSYKACWQNENDKTSLRKKETKQTAGLRIDFPRFKDEITAAGKLRLQPRANNPLTRLTWGDILLAPPQHSRGRGPRFGSTVN